MAVTKSPDIQWHQGNRCVFVPHTTALKKILTSMAERLFNRKGLLGHRKQEKRDQALGHDVEATGSSAREKKQHVPHPEVGRRFYTSGWERTARVVSKNLHWIQINGVGEAGAGLVRGQVQSP